MSNDILEYYARDLSACNLRKITPQEAAAASNAGDYNTLVESVLPLVVHLATRLHNGRADVEVLDMIQQGNLGVMTAARSWNPNGGAGWSSWAYLSAYREIGREYTRPASCGDTSLDAHAVELDTYDSGDESDVPGENHGQVESLADPAAGPEEITTQNELNQHIRSRLAGLPDRQAEAVSLYYLQDMNQSEVAAAMSVSRAAVQNLLQRGLQRLSNLGIG